VADFESDSQEQHGISRGFSNREDIIAISANDHRQGHLQISLEQVGDRRHPTVQDDVAGFRQRFVFEIDDIFQRERPPDDYPNQLQAVGFRKDQQRAAGERAIEILTDRN
jgi:light-regulated signal transduction histidine kinase (bacteriophytochrome)